MILAACVGHRNVPDEKDSIEPSSTKQYQAEEPKRNVADFDERVYILSFDTVLASKVAGIGEMQVGNVNKLKEEQKAQYGS
ncbi:unnamed protein product [Dibothriocephalus latus]|uniref:Uncharacterized protein n=1 Tax=Dibothriocephalus latus TaxID=60516 RepID=A0A3P7LFN5_DIBLA|nr:unnamed protein product [Dibothriocephalus latus]